MRKRWLYAVLWLIGIIGMAWSCEASEVLVGATYSRGLGEHAFAPYVEGRLDRGGWRLSGQGELSRKLESGRGYRLGVDVERTLGPAILTGAYRYRDGGAWRKNSAWAGAGVGSRDVRLVLRQEIQGNATRSATLTLAHRMVEWQMAGYSYRPTFGGERQHGLTVLLGLRLH